MMAYSEDHIALAAEYALGTLDAEERAQVETMMAVDNEYTGVVQAWEFRLGVLNQMVGSVEPRPIVWENIRRAIGLGEGKVQPPLIPVEAPPAVPDDQPALFDLPPIPPPAAANDIGTIAPEVREIAPAAAAPTVDNWNVVKLESRARRWRNVASFASAIAAALVVMVGMQVYRPDALPDAIRPKPRIQTVEVKTPAPPAAAQYVALLQGSANAPAFILTVDAATRNFTVRKVGAQPEAGKAYELWIVSDKLQRPRSLGLIGANDFTARPVLSGYDADVVNQATYAVSVEPPGGSPSGAPTGPVVFSGKLVETVPPGAAAR